MNTFDTSNIPMSDLHSPEVQAAATSRIGGPTVIGFIEPFFARKWTIVLTLLTAMLIGWLALLILPRKYQSEAKLLVKVGRESVSLDPTATTSETMMLQKTQEEEVNSALELMGSRYIKELTVKKLGAGAVLDGHLPGEGDSTVGFLEGAIDRVKGSASDALFHLLVFTGIKDELSDRELAVMQLDKNVDVYAPKKSAVIIVNSRSKSPEMARAISQSVIDTFHQEHLKTSRTDGSHEFFAGQAVKVEKQLSRLLNERSAMLQDRDIASVESKVQSLLSTLSGIETTVRDRLNALELQEVELASRYTPSHPRRTRLRRELDRTRHAVQHMQVDGSADFDELPVASRIPVRQASNNRLNANDVSQRLLDQKKQVESELRELVNFRTELDDMDREISLSQERLQKLRTKQEEARMIDEMQSNRFSNITVVQPPLFIERAAKPKKKLLAAGFTMFGLLGGIGLVVLRELSSNKIRTIHQLRALRLEPLIAQVPYRAGLLKRLQRLSGKIPDGLRKNSSVGSKLRPVLSEVTARKSREPKAGLLVGVMGINERVGASSIATALSMLADSRGIDTTLVDADSSNRTIGKLFQISDESDAMDTSEGDSVANDSATSDSATSGSATSEKRNVGFDPAARVRRPTKGALKCLSATSADRLVECNQAKKIVDWLRNQNDLAIVDLPCCGTANKVFDLAMFDGLVLVAEAEETTSEDVIRSVDRLTNQDVKIAAIVLNKSRKTMPTWIERIVS